MGSEVLDTDYGLMLWWMMAVDDGVGCMVMAGLLAEDSLKILVFLALDLKLIKINQDKQNLSTSY